ncbi:centriolar coiled-coil protein of 110 kDa [Pelodytes ibericus]
MEAYEEFCKTQFARIQGEAMSSNPVSADEHRVSVIQFHGVAVLSPLLTVERRQEMQQHKLKAIELDEKRQYCKKKTLLNRVQEILETVQVKNSSSTVNVLPSTEDDITGPTTNTKNMNGFALLPNIINLPMKSAQNGPAKFETPLETSPVNTTTDSKTLETVSVREGGLPLKQTMSPVSNNTDVMSSEVPQSLQTTDSDVMPPIKEAPDPYVMSLQNLLKKSREYIEKEQSRRNMKSYSQGVSNESHSDKENDTIKISDSLKEKARIINRSRSCSPLMADKPALNKSNTLLQAASSQGQSLGSSAQSPISKVDNTSITGTSLCIDNESDEDLKNSRFTEYESSIVKSLTGSYNKLPSPELSLSPKMHRRRPRPLSTGHIVINNPINAYDLSPNEKGKRMDCTFLETTAKTSVSDPVPKLCGYNAGICSVTRRSLNKNDIPSCPDVNETLQNSSVGSVTDMDIRAGSPTIEAGPPTAVCKRAQPTNNISSTSNTLHEPNTLTQALDISFLSTEQNNTLNGSAETIKRSSPAPLNKSYDVETPSPILMQSQFTNNTTDTPNISCTGEQLDDSNEFEVKCRLQLDLDNTQKDVTVPSISSDQEKKLLQEQRSRLGSLHLNIKNELSNSTLEDNLKKKMQAFEEMRKKLEEQHAQQLLLLIAEQEREQERLQREFEEEGQRLRFKDVDKGNLTGNPESCKKRPDKTNRSESSMSEIGTSYMEPHQTSSSHSTVGSIAAPSQQVYGAANESSFGLWRPSPSGAPKMSAQRPLGRARTRWSQVYSPAMQNKFTKVTALAKGFLTRRLMQSEKLKNLKQTVQDTAEFMRTFHTEGPVNRGIVSAQDASLRERVLAQLRAALYEIHDIFFAMDVTERMNILVHDRELRREKLIRQMEKMKSPRDRVTISSATQKSMDRKKLTRVVETGISNRKPQLKPKASETRILQPNQGQNAPINKLLYREGSICQKNPKKEAKCCDNLRRQHSLG